MREITEIIVHCTATRRGANFSASDINAWHRQRGFSCIGYHYVVKLDGTIETGRALARQGAHCVNHNKNSIGVVYVGGLEADGVTPADTRTPQQRVELRKLLCRLKADFPAAVIRSHRDFAAKACPCFDATAEYASISGCETYTPG